MAEEMRERMSGGTAKESDKIGDIMPTTRLAGKEYSPLVIRRYSMPFLHWVAIITDDDLTLLDHAVGAYWGGRNWTLPDTIQDMRNLAGGLQAAIQDHFHKTEGCAVILSADKMLVSSLAGDFMVHAQCRLELFALLNLSTQV